MHDPLPPAAEIAALPPDGGSAFNRLVHEASPYLRQHARNPVDWYPWGAEAFERARALDRPIFVSIGYSTCHWCHVMESESFEDDEVAEILADGYVAVKVDREERPDVDEIHMKATQLMSGHGGWPNSVWLTPDLRPWYAGTYFPPEDRPGRTGFKSLLRQLRTFWDEKREDVEEQATRLADAVRDIVQGEPEAGGGAPPGRPDVERLLHELRRSFDGTFGGFGGAPKFPPHGSLRILVAEVAEGDDGELREMLEVTLDALTRGGIHDHIGGGFHRYSTDREWLLPHFEKMLYDNAQLLSVLARADQLGIDGARATAEGIVDWVDREMTAEDGGFLAALDADSEGEEGRFYVWTPGQVDAVLGPERGPRFRRAYDISDDGNFTDEATGQRPGTSVPRLLRPLAEVARDEGTDREVLAAAFAEDRTALLAARAERVRPHLDDKVITGWCALFAGALAEAGSLLGHPEWVERAARAVDFLLEQHVRDGRLHRSSREGVLGPHAFLEDHAALGLACLDLASATGEERYAEEARRWAREIVARFEHPAGGFYDAAEDHELLLVRPRDPHDPAIPSGNGLAARLFHRLARLDDDDEADRIAAATVRAFAAAARRAPRGTEALLEVVRARAATDRPDPARGGSVAAEWAEGTVHLALDRLDAVPGGEVRVQLEGGFGTAGRWQHGQDAAPGPELVLASPEGATWRETDRSADAVAGTVTLPADTPAGPTLLAFEWRGAPCRKNACLPAVTVRVECAVLVRGG